MKFEPTKHKVLIRIGGLYRIAQIYEMGGRFFFPNGREENFVEMTDHGGSTSRKDITWMDIEPASGFAVDKTAGKFKLVQAA